MLDRYPAKLFFFSDFVDDEKIDHEILKAVMQSPGHPEQKTADAQLDEMLMIDVLYQSQAEIESDSDKIIDALVEGKAAIVVQMIALSSTLAQQNIVWHNKRQFKFTGVCSKIIPSSR